MRESTRTILTAATVATVIVLLLPVGAQAAGQLMTIVDADSATKAHVDGGKLRVGDGNGAMTVNGQVAARPALPASPFSISGDTTTGSEFVNLGRGRIAITDVVLSQGNDSGAAITVSVDLYREGGDGNCTTTGPHIKSVLTNTWVPAKETLAINLSTPVVGTGHPVCLVITTYYDPVGTVTSYTVTGYRT